MRAERWVSEAAFFDRLAEQARNTMAPIDTRVLRRYSGGLRRRFSKELRLKLLGDVRGRRVLDLGCGDGTNATLLALRGAKVTGIDISPGQIEISRRRAEVNGVTRRTRFICSPLEMADLPANHFDIIWADGILHHVIPELDQVLTQAVRWARSGAQVVLSEPVNRLPFLRRLRLRLPIHTDATPDERPLERDELAVVKRHLPGLKVRPLALASRFDRFVLKGDYETASLPRRLLCEAMHAFDYGVLSLPLVGRLGGMAVLHGRILK